MQQIYAILSDACLLRQRFGIHREEPIRNRDLQKHHQSAATLFFYVVVFRVRGNMAMHQPLGQAAAQAKSRHSIVQGTH